MKLIDREIFANANFCASIIYLYITARVGVARNMEWPSVGTTLFGLKGFPPGRSVVSILISLHHHCPTHRCHCRQIGRKL